jgi:hypothetical protein
MADRNWEEIVANSNGTLEFLPESLIPLVKAWAEKRAALNKLANEAAKIEFETTIALHAAVMAIRTHYADGRPNIWSSDVGVEGGALAEGKYIVTINEGGPGK